MPFWRCIWEPGSGVTVASALSENDLDRNWQRLILTHLTEREHLGVLVGAPLTDIKMTLVAGRAHLKHTEGGDFRQDRKSTRLNSSHPNPSRMPSSA